MLLKLVSTIVTLLCITLASNPAIAAWSDVNIWVDNCMEKYRQNGEDGTSGSNTLTIYCAKNEFEPFQVLLFNAGTQTEKIHDVTVTQVSGPGSISDIFIYRMHYINCSSPSRSDYQTGYYPDPLVPKIDRYFGESRTGPAGWPVTGIDVAPSRVQGFWIDLGTTPDTPAGVYELVVRVKQTGQDDKTATVTLTVWDFALPSTPTMKSFFVIEGSILDNGHGLSYGGTSSELAGLEALYVKSMLYHKICISTRDMGSYYTTVDENAAVSDWSIWEIAYKAALDGTAISSGPYAGARLPSIDVELGSTAGSRDANSTSWVSYLQSWWDKFVAEGWDPINNLHCYGWDEPNGGSFDYRGGTYTDFQIVLKKAAGMNAVNTGGAGLWKNTFTTSARTSALSNPGADYISLDISGTYCPIGNRYSYRPPWQLPSYMIERESYPGYPNYEKKDHIAYLACPSHGCGIIGGAYYNNHPDLMLETPPILTRGIAWIWWHYKAHGFLYYHVNELYSNGDPWYNTYSIYAGNGDGLLFYPGVPDRSVRNCAPHTPSIGGTHDIPIESIRLKLFREGWEDREYMELLRIQQGESIADNEVNVVFMSIEDPEGAYFQLYSDSSYILNARRTIAARILSSEPPSPPIAPNNLQIIPK